MSIRDLNQYEIIKDEDLQDVKCHGYLLKHKKSGAKLVLMEADDDNKVFSVGFRTPPEDSTGLPHILEHSVLCGSDHFPVKDPFVELVKGSLNTFLNAMTYPDKTMYPVASCNDKDFQNLMQYSIRISISMRRFSVRRDGVISWIQRMRIWNTTALYIMR